MKKLAGLYNVIMNLYSVILFNKGDKVTMSNIYLNLGGGKLDRLKLDLKMPCPNCGGKDFGTMSEPYCILPSLVKGEEGYELSPDKGLGIMPVICNTCGYILLFHPPQKKN